ncbi:MAG: hypothetical protein R3B70_07700 [Polyangiaceae bacterium]
MLFTQGRRSGGMLACALAALFVGCVDAGAPLDQADEDIAETQQALVPQDWSFESVPSIDGEPTTEAVDGEVIAIRSLQGVQTAPIAESIRQSIEDDILENPGEGIAYFVSVEGSEALLLHEAGIDASYELESTAEDPQAPALDPIAGKNGGEPSAVAGTTTSNLLGCGDVNEKKTKQVTLSQSYSTSANLGGGFSGSLSATTEMTGSATVELAYRAKRVWLFGCRTYWVKPKYVRAVGSMQGRAAGSVNGTLSYNYEWEKQVAKLDLSGVSFFVGPIPVYIGFNVPISVGLSLSASTTGTLQYQGADTKLSGAFDYQCSFGDGCSGTSSFSPVTNIVPENITGSLSGRVNAKLWAQAAFRAYLWSESVAYAQVGVRPALVGDLWGYTGNNCGDANGDGSNEWVNALTFDMDAQLFLTAKASVFNKTVYQNNDLWHTSPKHLLFKELVTSSALTPMLSGTSTPIVNQSTSYSAKMRPCWPYTNKVTGTVTWGDGASSGVSMPQYASHAWSSTGTRSLQVTATKDAHGRILGNKATTRSVKVVTSAPLPSECVPGKPCLVECPPGEICDMQ